MTASGLGQIGDQPAPPALVSLVTSGGRLTARAYAATILDLAARGLLVTTTPRPGELWCALPAGLDAVGASVGAFEQPVLDQVTRVAGRTGAPFHVLADSHASDLPRAWRPFAAAVTDTAKRAGLVRPRVPLAVRVVVVIAVVGAFVLVVRSQAAASHHFSSAHHSPVATVLLVVGALAALLVLPRLLRYGAALTVTSTGRAMARATRPPDRATLARAASAGQPGAADLSLLACAVAIGVPVPGMLLNPSLVRGRGTGSAGQPPAQAWSSLTGQWRLVPIGPVPRQTFTAASSVVILIPYLGWTLMFAFGAYFAVIVPADLWRLPVAAGLGALAVLIGSRFVTHLVTWLTRNVRAEVTGQVIAIWQVTYRGYDDDVVVSHLAVDDGRRAWHLLSGGQEYAWLATGDLVKVRFLRRSARILDLTRLTADAIRPTPQG